ncbi:S-adenosyl-L-methionine:benzoic acid/salicylic acid carboxyl methyltransferase 1-like [Amaranthus tricolor]|uniref:S-adenosyl-L-methionine:benzoic acid/salicylic acid carboxyl methyltransferase 1-like n=1 Tax=Amaranthus tricolor TaxID=29722 RepID=UPI00259021C9|nr:S-adenosyl-L-methionine:benzoic acid/salicylic acid carboxyl methyltransferase 1-like [Amaranthus tricolor]
MAKQLWQVFRMNGGNDETSFAKTSYVQKQILSLTKPIKDEAITEMYSKQPPTKAIRIADLGCSSSEKNSLIVIFDLIQTIDNIRRRFKQDPKEYQIYLNDLPGNDFNTLFGSITNFEDRLLEQIGDDFGHCFVNGVPGSFYGRIFPTNTMNFVHSSSSLHWLSQVPENIIENQKRNIYMSRASPPSVLKAYYEQFEKDFLKFLHCRAMEMVDGGKMVLTLLGRQNNQYCYAKESSYSLELLSNVLNDMVSEGNIDEAKLNTFNIAAYTPSPLELEFLVKKEGSFNVNLVHVFQVSWDWNDYKFDSTLDDTSDQYDFTTCMRSVLEPLIIAHFGQEIVDEVFERYREKARVSMAEENNVLTNVSISLTRIPRVRG